VIRRTLHKIRGRLAVEAPPSAPSAPSDPARYFPVALMHLPHNPTLAPVVILDPDPDTERSRGAVARVIDAYEAALRAAHAPSPSMWAGIETKHAAFLEAMRARDTAVVRDTLARLFHTSLIWGLGRVHPDTPGHIRSGQPEGVQIQIADALVSLAEATGVARITCIEQQGVDGHLAALQADTGALLTAIVDRTGLETEMPPLGGNYGCEIAGRRVSIDSLVHAYTPYRLRQLGVGGGERVAEIGGGYGCLSYICRRSGFTDYTIYDLPWVNVLQGYVLIMSLPPDEVSLFGEPDRPVRVRPFWEFAALPNRSVDVVINTDSLPEIGEDTARRYIADIARVVRRGFLSINQEAMAHYPGIGPQLNVNALVAAEPRLRNLHRHRYWMRQGYVEEWFVPASS
jgi:hypothetical protein